MASEAEQMKGALDRIHEIVGSVIHMDGIPEPVRKALDDIAANARYKFDVTGGRGGAESSSVGEGSFSSGSIILDGGPSLDTGKKLG